MKAFVGIDNGLDGGIVAVDEHRNILLQVAMPVVKHGKGREVDPVEVVSLLTKLRESSESMNVLLETAGKFSNGVMALCSTHDTFGQIKSGLKCFGFPWELVPPQRWQRVFWTRPKMPKGVKFDTKAAALNAANRIWPGRDWRKSERSKNPHDGIVDAALIADYCRRKFYEL